jgi:glutaminase
MAPTDVRATAIQEVLNEAHARFAGLREGRAADYIPELAKASPEDFGIVLATTGGHIYGVGDGDRPFSIQSISKPFTYALALKLLSAEQLMRKVGVEPSGDAFNAISLDPDSGIPRNPMINAGAIATTAQILAHAPEQAETLLLDFYAAMAGRRLAVDEAVFRSERDSGHRNRAIGHLLRTFGIIDTDPEPGLQLYFRQCAVAVTCRDLAVMAATLACQGRNPFTGETVIDAAITTNVLAVMGSCGMYDYTGQWLYNVGMPAKSGVGGGVLAVVPGRLGLAVYSPPLDGYGNSVRGTAVCEWLSQRLELHLFNQPPMGGSAIRSAADGSQRHSRRWRSASERQRLDHHGGRIQVLQLQGVFDFAATEALLAQIDALAREEQGREGSCLVLDLARVIALPEVAAGLVLQQLGTYGGSGGQVLLCHGDHLPALWRDGELSWEGTPWMRCFRNLDDALEHAEDRLLAALEDTLPPLPGGQAEGVLERLSEASRLALTPVLQCRDYEAGAVVCRRGEPGRELYLITSGRFSARLVNERHQAGMRLASFGAGSCFGEVAFLSESARSADVIADQAGSCLVLNREDLERLGQLHPQAVIELLRVLHNDLAAKLQRTSDELSLLEEA